MEVCYININVVDITINVCYNALYIKINEGDTVVVDSETGEIVGDRFAKLFFDDIEKLFILTGTERALLDLMIKDCRLGGYNSINMTPKRKKQYAEALGLKTYRSITNMLNSMCLKDVIKDKRNPEDHPYIYQINPHIIFKGNDYQRAKIIIDYTDGKRNVRAVSGKVYVEGDE
jgi:hypothetical protein